MYLYYLLLCMYHFYKEKIIMTSLKQQFDNLYSYLRKMWKANCSINIFILF